LVARTPRASTEVFMRWFLSWLVVGAFFGATVATLIAPVVLETLLASTGAKDAMCQCTELVNNTASLLIKTQLWGAGAGAGVFPIAAWLVKRGRSKKLPAGV
jgi:hypothetical protein